MAAIQPFQWSLGTMLRMKTSSWQCAKQRLIHIKINLIFIFSLGNFTVKSTSFLKTGVFF
jgi:hypothetical protein